MPNPIPSNYQSTLKEIKQLVLQARHQALRKVNTELIKMYRNIGQMIFQKTSFDHWGNSVVDTLSYDLQQEFPGVKGLSSSNLRRMKHFYEIFSQDEKVAQLVRELPWGHIVIVCEKLKDQSERIFYVQKTIEEQRSRATLQENIQADLYHKQSIQHNFTKTLPMEVASKITRELRDE